MLGSIYIVCALDFHLYGDGKGDNLYTLFEFEFEKSRVE